MKLKEVTSIQDIKEGDTLLLTGQKWKNKSFEVYKICLTEYGHEVIIDKKNNYYFTLESYFKGSSWVKELKVVVDDVEDSTTTQSTVCYSFPQIYIEEKEISLSTKEIESLKEMDIDQKATWIWSKMSELEQNCTQGEGWIKSALDEGYCGFTFKEDA